ncbi:type ISP restriction/modification enzyme [Campylobacter sp. MIT 97-5078]|uniref:type ISP restriction/modification enzyme n=1 Tax=Campylobacter sp. MIT 97-5078 TaxID=1548153 RepID=UPI003917C1B3
MFAKTGLGICTYRDFFCYANSKDELKNRIELFSKQEIESNRTYFNLPKDSRDWTIQNAKQEFLQTNLNDNLIKRYILSLLTLNIFILLENLKGFWGVLLEQCKI